MKNFKSPTTNRLQRRVEDESELKVDRMQYHPKPKNLNSKNEKFQESDKQTSTSCGGWEWVGSWKNSEASQNAECRYERTQAGRGTQAGPPTQFLFWDIESSMCIHILFFFI